MQSVSFKPWLALCPHTRLPFTSRVHLTKLRHKDASKFIRTLDKILSSKNLKNALEESKSTLYQKNITKSNNNQLRYTTENR